MLSFTQLKQKRGKSEKSCIPAHPNTTALLGCKSEAPVEVEPGSCNVEILATLPQDLEIRIHAADQKEKGRGLYSRRGRKPGDIILTTKPHVSALSNDHLEGNCSNCFVSRTSLRRCTSCTTIFYCDSECQKEDWSLHKQECAAIKRWASGSSTVPGDAVRCLGRILWKKRKLGQDSAWAREIDYTQSHRTSIGREPHSRNSETYSQLAHAVVRFLGLISPQEMAEYGLKGAADLVDLISRFTTNTFTISTSALAPLGACVSPIVALINHSCDPNAVVVFPRVNEKKQEPIMHVIALKNISPDEEILISYVDTTLPREIRRKQLRETYYFDCRCHLCSQATISSVLDMREAMFCPKKCGRVCALPTEGTNVTQCSGCNTTVKGTDAIIDAVRVGQEALNKAEALQFSNPEKSIQLTTNLIPILTTAGLTSAAHPLLAISRLNTSLLIANLPATPSAVQEVRSPALRSSYPEPSQPPCRTPSEAQEVLNEAIRAATRSWTGLSQLLPEGHPVRGVSLAELGKLLCVDEPYPQDLESQCGVMRTNVPLPSSVAMIHSSYPPSGPGRLQLAYETLLRARSELIVGFGENNEGGELGKVVRSMVIEVEKELNLWREGIRNTVRDLKASKTN